MLFCPKYTAYRGICRGGFGFFEKSSVRVNLGRGEVCRGETDKISPPYPLAAVGLLCRALRVVAVALSVAGAGRAVGLSPCRLPYLLRVGCTPCGMWPVLYPCVVAVLPAVGRLVVNAGRRGGRRSAAPWLWPYLCRLLYLLRAGCSVSTWWASMCAASLSPAVMLGRI